MKWLRNAWIGLHILLATTVCGSLTILASLVDRSKRYIGWWPRAWGRWVLWSSGLSITVEGREHLRKGQQYIYICNHTSAMDIPLALATLPGTVVFMAKKELFRIFFFGWSLKATGSIPVDRSNPVRARHSMARALEALEAKALSIILYPEGTRSPDGRLLPFKKGVFHIALQSRLPLVPMAVQGAFEALPPNSMSLTHMPIKVTIGQPMETRELMDKDRDTLLEQARERVQALLETS